MPVFTERRESRTEQARIRDGETSAVATVIQSSIGGDRGQSASKVRCRHLLTSARILPGPQ